ncbi:J domain-containing protein [Uruburuella testudinis]|uniref:J domain-containing protein n=1 Tax=Uruburuella testudinis TaxID=1282863 RepID=A0ABY4DUD1_9NEIS|nr:J domain-containing protein [Uruburuella testudinis]UOO82319.1 J domain-containing protein [Uruburuella testudinis]
MAKRLHTHYDNLKVARDASPEAIRTAYRMLCKKYHPDQNRQNPDAHRIMSLINRSYQVLSHPEQRCAHDKWIETQIAKQDVDKISSPMPGGFRKVQEPLPYAKLALWLLAVALIIAALAYCTAQQRRDAPFMPTASSGRLP